jgi:hypothetical protein
LTERHCEPAGGATRRPLREAIQRPGAPILERLDCFVASAPRNDGGGGVNALRKFSDSNFKQPNARVLAPPRELSF